MAAGVERIVMLLTGGKTVREVALFPMNQQAADLLMGAPSEVFTEATARAFHPRRRAGEEDLAGIVIPGEPTCETRDPASSITGCETSGSRLFAALRPG